MSVSISSSSRTPPPVARPTAPYVQPTAANDARLSGDGYDASRDITGLEAQEGKPTDPYVLRVTLANLKADAAQGHLDVHWLIGTGAANGATTLPGGLEGRTEQPWNLAVAAHDETHRAAVDAAGKPHDEAVEYARFDSVRRVVEVGIDKQALREAGWRDGQPLTLQAMTACDGQPQISDSLDGGINSAGVLRRAVNTGEAPTPLQARSQDWGGESIYFAFTDRFQNGDKTNDIGTDADLRHYHGGDLRGIIDKLDYIKDLGMTTLWISPPMLNQTRYENYEGFHGYWPVDFEQVDPRQGDMATLKELVAQAHDRGLKVLMDLPLNQTAWDHPWTKDPTRQDWFHHNGNITNWEDPVQVEKNDVLGLPDLAQENPAVARELIDVAKFWIDQTGIDGYRLDAVKHVTFSFWPQFAEAMRAHAGPDFLLTGEDLHGFIPHVARYQTSGGIRSMLDFPTYYAIRDSIGNGGSMRGLADRIAEENATFDNARMLSLFIDNHDLNRFVSDAAHNGGDARNKLKLALTAMFTLDRIPNVYMGDEVGMDGTQEGDNPEHEPYNRKDMDFDRDPELRQFFTTLATLRKNTEALREGGYVEAWKDDQVFAYERPSRNGTALVVLNGDGAAQHRDIPVPLKGNLEEGMRLRDALSGDEVVVKDGRIAVDMAGRSSRVWLAA